MSAQDFPVIGNWYRDYNQQLFEVVALDDADNLIEIQYWRGNRKCPPTGRLDWAIW